MKNLPAELVDVLHLFQVVDNKIVPPKLPIDNSMYGKAKRLFLDIGATWKKGAFNFPFDPKAIFHEIVTSGVIPDKNPDAFFPTPSPIIENMIALADSDLFGLMEARSHAVALGNAEPLKFLDPDTGTGSISDYIRPFLGNNILDTVEINHLNQNILKRKGYTPFCGDFLMYNTNFETLYDYIFMNPPFSTKGRPRAYIDHFEHAFNMLKPNGTIVCVAPSSVLNANSRRESEFIERYSDNIHFYIEHNDPNAFRESGTNIDTVVFSLLKHRPIGDKKSGEHHCEAFARTFTFDGTIVNKIETAINRASESSERISIEIIDNLCHKIIDIAREQYTPILIPKKYLQLYRKTLVKYLNDTGILNYNPVDTSTLTTQQCLFDFDV